MPQGNTQFLCCHCEAVIAEFHGEHMIVSYMAECPWCRSLNAIQYAFPLAKVQHVYPNDEAPIKGGDRGNE